jgi:hypothetical protein
MKTKTKVIGVATVITSLLMPIAQANIPITRQTNDGITLYDNGSEIRAFDRVIANGYEGIKRIENLGGELGSDILRTTNSRFNCEIPVNPHCDGSDFNQYCDPVTKQQEVFPNEKDARKWVGSCFNEQTIFDIESDLAIAMARTGSTRAFYQFRDTVQVRRPSDMMNTEEREIYYTVILDKNEKPGNAYKSGVTISESEYKTNLYVVYENSGTVDLLDDAVSSDNAGDLIVYKMDGSLPESSTLTEVETFQNPDFDTERLVENDPNFQYETDGVKNVLAYASLLKEHYNPDVLIVDYHNPITIKQCAVGNDGSCLPESHSQSDPIFKPRMDILTTDRTFYRNVCTGEGVTYTQTNRVEADVNSIVERYVITPESNINGEMTDQELLALDRLVPFEIKDNETVVKEFYASHSGFTYNTGIRGFDDRITEYLGKNSVSPTNTLSPLSPTCTGLDSYEDIDCYDRWNGLHHDHYIKPIPAVEDISIVDVNYEERVMTSPSTTEIDEDGNEVIVPAVYDWIKKNTCNTTSGTRTYNVNEFCSGSNIKCLSVDRM